MSSIFFINPRSNPELTSLFRIAMLPQLNHLQDYFLGAMAILADYFPIGYSALLLQDSQKGFRSGGGRLWHGKGISPCWLQWSEGNHRQSPRISPTYGYPEFKPGTALFGGQQRNETDREDHLPTALYPPHG